MKLLRPTLPSSTTICAFIDSPLARLFARRNVGYEMRQTSRWSCQTPSIPRHCFGQWPLPHAPSTGQPWRNRRPCRPAPVINQIFLSLTVSPLWRANSERLNAIRHLRSVDTRSETLLTTQRARRRPGYRTYERHDRRSVGGRSGRTGRTRGARSSMGKPAGRSPRSS